MSCFDVKIERAKLQFELSSVLVGVLSSSLLALDVISTIPNLISRAFTRSKWVGWSCILIGC